MENTILIDPTQPDKMGQISLRPSESIGHTLNDLYINNTLQPDPRWTLEGTSTYTGTEEGVSYTITVRNELDSHQFPQSTTSFYLYEISKTYSNNTLTMTVGVGYYAINATDTLGGAHNVGSLLKTMESMTDPATVAAGARVSLTSTETFPIHKKILGIVGASAADKLCICGFGITQTGPTSYLVSIDVYNPTSSSVYDSATFTILYVDVFDEDD